MKQTHVVTAIEKAFRNQVKKDTRLKNAYLLVHSDKADVHLNLALGSTGSITAHPDQPNYMASVGKLFTATIIARLYEEGKLSFDDPITMLLDQEIVSNLHVYKGKDYTESIKVRHLLNHTSGLADNFWPLLDQLIENPEMPYSPQEAITWVKEHSSAHAPPGQSFKYTDTNYHLLGLIIEGVTKKPYHAVLQDYIFKPLNMKHSYMLHYSDPLEKSDFPTAEFYHGKTRLNDIKGYAGLDYAGGGVVAPMQDLLIFMKALVANQFISKATLDIMKSDQAKFGLGIQYGYGIWQITTVPLLMPKSLNSWGAAGATGAFMFYHPASESYVIGNFNDFAYQSKAIRFMLMKVIGQLVRCTS